MERINEAAGEPAKKDRLFEIYAKLRKRQADTEASLWILTGGDVTQTNELRQGTMWEYIGKLNNFDQVREVRESKGNILKQPMSVGMKLGKVK